MATLPIYEGPVGEVYGNYLSGESIGRSHVAPLSAPEREVKGALSLEVLESTLSLGGLAACAEPELPSDGRRAVQSGRLPITDVRVKFV
jgi:hypothetical protein